MANIEEPEDVERIFTLNEANCLIPQLEEICVAIQKGRAIVIRTRDEIKKASAQAHLGGGSVAGPQYIQALQRIHVNLKTLHEMGVLIKDVDIGLCDFLYRLNGRTVCLCWKLGEEKIHWWHEVFGGYSGRQRLPEEAV